MAKESTEKAERKRSEDITTQNSISKKAKPNAINKWCHSENMQIHDRRNEGVNRKVLARPTFPFKDVRCDNTADTTDVNFFYLDGVMKVTEHFLTP